MSRRDRGGASLELVILAPFLLMLLMFIIGLARFTEAKSKVDQAARDAARAATSVNSKAAAQTAAGQAVHDALVHAPSSCRQSAGGGDVQLSSRRAFQPVSEDQAAVDPAHLESVTVTVSCQVDIGDLVFLPLGTKTARFTFTSPLDKYRGYQR